MVQYKEYQDPKKFWIDVALQLRSEESKNSLFLGLAYNFQNNSADCLYQSAVFDDRRLIGALLCSRYQGKTNLVVASTEYSKSVEKFF